MGGHILLVEDDWANREALALLLRLSGYEVDTATNGAEALDQLRAGDGRCLVLLDLRMPVMDGWEVLRRRRQDDPALAAPPVVVLSALGGPNREALLALGARAVLQKPADPEELLGIVRRYC